MKSVRGRESSRLLSLPDELLQPFLARVDHPRDRCSLALSCSQLRRLSRRTPHSLRLHFFAKKQGATAREWIKNFDIYSGVFTHIIDLAVEVSCTTIDQLLGGIGAGCPKLERLKLVSVRDPRFQINAAAWGKLARQCPLSPPPPSPPLPPLSPSRHLSRALSPSHQPHNVTGARLPTLPEVHRAQRNAASPSRRLPALRSLTLLYEPSHYRFIDRCSSLTSLTLWRPSAFALYSLASPSSPLHLSLASLTIHSAVLEAALAPLASFPRLATLAFHSCTIDPCELHAFARSLHTLTHLAILNCPLVSSHVLAPLVETNPALSSLSLHSTSYPLFAAQGLRTMLARSSSRLHTLTLSGLPSYRPGMLARCSSLQRLTLKGARRRGRVLCRLSRRRSPAHSGMSGNRWRRYYLYIRAEAAAANADTIAAMDDSRAVLKNARWKLKKAAEEGLQTRRMHGEFALIHIRNAVIKVRAAMSLCRCMRVAVAEVDGRMARVEALVQAGAAADAAGLFTAALDPEREEKDREREGQGGGGREVEELVAFIPESDLSADLADVSEALGEETGMWPAIVAVSRAEARALLHVLTGQLMAQMLAIGDAFEPALPPVPGAVFASTRDPSWLPSHFPSASPRMCPSPHTAPLPYFPTNPPSPYAVPSLNREPQSFRSLARAAVFGRVKSLAILNCSGLRERHLVRLLRACAILEDLRVEGSDALSDTVIAGSKLEVLTRLTVVGCGGVTADGIGGLLGHMPRLRYLEVEASKSTLPAEHPRAMGIPRTVPAAPFAASAWLTLFMSSLMFSNARDLSIRHLPATRNSEDVTASNVSSVPSSSSREFAGFDGARGNDAMPISHSSLASGAASAEVGEPAQFSTRPGISGYDGPRLAGESATPEWLDRDALHELEERLKDLLGGEPPLGINGDDDDGDKGAFEADDWESPGPTNYGDKDEYQGGGFTGATDENAAITNLEREVGVRTTIGVTRSSTSSAGDRGSIRRSNCGSGEGCGGAGGDATVRRRSLGGKPIVPNLTVAQDGSGDVTNLQDAVRMINSEMSKSWYIVQLKPGRYVGNVEVERANVVLLGSGAWRTVVTGNRSNGAGFETWDTPSFAVAGNNFVAMGIRFENTAPASMEAAVAFRSAGDRTIAYRCVFSGFQDTLNSHRGRQYYRNCAISGHVDFIYGRHGAAVFDRCRIVPLKRPGENGAATIATHGGETRSKREGGFIFYRCWIAANAPGVTVYLGRPWRAHARVVYMFSYLSNAVLPEGWVPWPGEGFGPKAFLGEYQNTGPGAGMSGRARWVRPGLLSEAQVAPFMPEAFIRGSRWVGKSPVEIVYP
ncbi:unnamed protein product [Closterium sp. Naga37s-1]|nr:unnamed protein product [Closterium sp. Naga37s-1]